MPGGDSDRSCRARLEAREIVNFLAHLWLADATATSAAGAVLGDLLHGRVEDAGLPAALALGVRIHRRVDAVTDRHPLSVGWRETFPAGHRRYAGVVLDLLCDHALARDWPVYHDDALPDFAARAGSALAAEAEWFDRCGGWRPQAGRFAALLESYAEWAGFERAVLRTAERLRQPQRLIAAAEHSLDRLPEVRRGLPRLLADLRVAAEAVGDG